MDFVRPKRATLSLDMAPLIDVVFQLLIFFMLTSSFPLPSLKLNLPKAVQQETKEPERIVISVDSAGRVAVDSTRVSMEELTSHLQSKLASDRSKSVHLRGDQDMPYRFFVEVMDKSRRAGARQIHIVHEKSRQ